MASIKIPQHFKCTLAIKPAQVYTWQGTKQRVSWLSVLLSNSQTRFFTPTGPGSALRSFCRHKHWYVVGKTDLRSADLHGSLFLHIGSSGRAYSSERYSSVNHGDLRILPSFLPLSHREHIQTIADSIHNTAGLAWLFLFTCQLSRNSWQSLFC